jgi:putative transposase
MRSSKPSTAASGPKCLNVHWFLSLADAQEKVERPHGAIANKPPIMLLNHDGAASPPL